jgi:hypothetical protein
MQGCGSKEGYNYEKSVPGNQRHHLWSGRMSSPGEAYFLPAGPTGNVADTIVVIVGRIHRSRFPMHLGFHYGSGTTCRPGLSTHNFDF